jgi:MFS family permease
VQTRLALFYCASALSGAFSGLLAFGIAKMDGIGGRPGWAWIFLLEGIVTVIIGAACFFIMPDTPALSGKWLTAEEMHYFAIQNMIKDGGRATSEQADKFKWSYLIDLVTDYKVYLQAWILFTASVCAYGKSHSTSVIDHNTHTSQVSSSRCLQSPSQWATPQPKPSS